MNKKLLISLLTTVPTIGIVASTTILTSCKSSDTSNQVSNSNISTDMADDTFEKESGNLSNNIENKSDIGMLYYKDLIINKNREDKINFNPLSKYDYESFKRIAFTNAYEKLQTNKSDEYSNFRLKLYGRDLGSNEDKWTQLESLNDELIHDAIDYAIKNYYYSKNLWLMDQARFDVDLSLVETNPDSNNPGYFPQNYYKKGENNYAFTDLWFDKGEQDGFKVISNKDAFGNKLEFRGLNFNQLLMFNMFLNNADLRDNKANVKINKGKKLGWYNAEWAEIKNLFYKKSDDPKVNFKIKYFGGQNGAYGNGCDIAILRHGSGYYYDQNFLSFKVDILKAYDYGNKDSKKLYIDKDINVSLDKESNNILSNSFIDYLNKNKYNSVYEDDQKCLKDNILKYKSLSDNSKKIFNEIVNQVTKNIYDFENEVCFNTKYVNLPSYWWDGKKDNIDFAYKWDISRFTNDNNNKYDINNIKNKALLIQNYNNSFSQNIDKKILYLDNKNTNGFNVIYNSQILKFKNKSFNEIGIFENKEVIPVIEYNAIPLFKINLNESQMNKLQNISANDVIKYDSNKYHWVLDNVMVQILGQEFYENQEDKFYDSFQNVSQNISFETIETGDVDDPNIRYIPTFKEESIITLNDQNKIEFNYSVYNNNQAELLNSNLETLDLLDKNRYRINSIIKQYNSIKDFYYSILNNQFVKPEEIVFVYNWMASPQRNNVINSLELDYITNEKWNNNPYVLPYFINQWN